MSDLARLAAKIDRVAKELTDQELLKAVGLEGKRIGTEEVRQDAGDNRMSNWRRGRPINLASRFDYKGDDAVEIAPAPRARGPVRVLTSGRQPGTARSGRPVSGSRGKGTWERAGESMQRELPKVAAKHTTAVLRKHF